MNLLGWLVWLLTGQLLSPVPSPRQLLADALAAVQTTYPELAASPSKCERLLSECEHLHEPLQLLADGWSQDEHLSLSGRRQARANLTGALINHLSCLHVWNSHYAHDYDAENNHRQLPQPPSITQPIFIIGWPRTGSTLLHNMLSHHPQLRAPLLWEVLQPALAAETKSDDEVRRHISNTTNEIEPWFEAEPNLRFMHAMRADAPDECCHLLEQTLVDRHTPIIASSMNAYAEWLYSRTPESMRPFYRFYRKQLELIATRQFATQQHGPSIFVLKDSTHMLFVEALLLEFPDARIIHTIRDAASVAGSCCSGFSLLSNFYYSRVDKHGVARRVMRYLEACARSMNRAQDSLAQQHTRRVFFDVPFQELASEPARCVLRLCNDLGLEWTPTIQATMREKEADSRVEHQRNRHRYTLSQHEWALDDTQARERLVWYTQRFLQTHTPA